MQTLIKRVKKIFAYPMIWVLIVLLVVSFPTALNLRSVAYRCAIMVALGIDKTEDEQIIVYGVANISYSDSLAENSKIVSAKGDTFGDALGNLTISFNRDIRLGHVRFILIGSGIAQSDVSKELDRVVRTNKIRNSTQFLYCATPIDEIFDLGIDLRNNVGIQLSELLCHQEKFSNTLPDSNIDYFYKGYLSNSSVSKINAVSVSNDESKGINPNGNSGGESSSMGSSGSSSSSTPGGSGQEDKNAKPKKYISNVGELAIFKNGRLQKVLSQEVSEGVNWLNTKSFPKRLIVNTGDIDSWGAGKANFDVVDKKVNVNSFFYKNKPYLDVKINLTINIDEIISNSSTNKIIKKVLDQSIKADIGDTIREQIALALTESKNINLDIFGINDIFNTNNYHQYVNYLNNGGTVDSIFHQVLINCDVGIKVI